MHSTEGTNNLCDKMTTCKEEGKYQILLGKRSRAKVKGEMHVLEWTTYLSKVKYFCSTQHGMDDKLTPTDFAEFFIIKFHITIFFQQYYYCLDFSKANLLVNYTSQILGALKQGPCTSSTFKAFDLTSLHILCS